MELVIVKCPNCFGQIQLDKNREKNFCMYCRKEIIEKPQTRQEVELEILEIKLGIVRETERLYNADQRAFEEVIAAYDVAKPLGERLPEYWLARARFFTRGSLKELNRVTLSIGRKSSITRRYKVSHSDREKIIDQYVELMDNAIRYDVDNKERLAFEKKQTVDKMHSAFDAKIEEDRKDQQLSHTVKRLGDMSKYWDLD